MMAARLIGNKVVIPIVALLILFLNIAGPTNASVSHEISPKVPDENTTAINITLRGVARGETFKICDKITDPFDSPCMTVNDADDRDGILEFSLTDSDGFEPGPRYFEVKYQDDVIYAISFRVIHFYPTVEIKPKNPFPGEVTVTLSNTTNQALIKNYDYQLVIEGTDKENEYKEQRCTELKKDQSSTSKSWNIPREGTYLLKVADENSDDPLGIGDGCDGGFLYWNIIFIVGPDGGIVQAIKDPNDKEGQRTGGKSGEFKPEFSPDCIVQNNCPEEIQTPLGPIKTTPAGLATAFVSLGLGIAGGVAFLLMVFGSYRLIFAGGNPEAIQQGREVITAAVIGLIVVVFSVFLLRLVGVSLLGLPL